jgi:hypothetical protein
MDKLDALRVLSNAYHFMAKHRTFGDQQAMGLLNEKFGYVRRSLRIEELESDAIEDNEGYNGRMPMYF